MKRRNFLKSLGIMGAAMTMPSLFWERISEAALPDGLGWAMPSVKPQMINIFLYGGPSPLAGNLTNIAAINANSKNKYEDWMLGVHDTPGTDAGGVITKNGFWGPIKERYDTNTVDANGQRIYATRDNAYYSAGGEIMEKLIKGEVTIGGVVTAISPAMSIYRTCYRVKDNNMSHGPSVTQNLLGNLDQTKPGIATNLAAVLSDKSDFLGKPLSDLQLPFVTFEGESPIFNLGDLNIDLLLRPVALNANLDTPYSRSSNGYLNQTGADDTIENLARTVSAATGESQKKINDAFISRTRLAKYMYDNFRTGAAGIVLPTGVTYDANNTFAAMLKAAVHLAIVNPDTFFISLGSPGLGGWDEHSNALISYRQRMQQVMSALNSAVTHMWVANKRNLVINVFGDFGRNVNLNDAGGWDHGNNQNFYTVGGWDIPGRALGKLVGTTDLTDVSSGRFFTKPVDGTYYFEPMAIASTIYKYFGVTNPQLLTGEEPIDETVNQPNLFVP